MNIGALVPIRLLSERLPNKALLKINGRPVCFHLFDQIFASRYISSKKQIVVCTTSQKSDDLLVEAAHDYGCSIFRGHPDDIIDRFYSAMTELNLDLVIQVDGDDPLSSTEYMDMTMETLMAEPELDIVTITGLPLGCATKSFSLNAVKIIKSAYLTKKNDTGFIYYFTKTNLCRHYELICLHPLHQHKTARLTMDYREDFELFKVLLETLKRDDLPLTLEEVVAFLNKNPLIANLNAKVENDYWRRTREKVKLQYKSLNGQVSVINL